MKRKNKILLIFAFTLFITLVISTALAASAATVTGVTVKSSDDFQSASDTFGGTASDGSNPRTPKGTTFQQGGRTGKVELVNLTPYSMNKYAVITQTDSKSASGPYMWAGVGARPTTSTLNNSADDMKNYSYYTFDIDVMSPTGKFISGATVDLSARYADNTGTVTFWNNTAINRIVELNNDSTGSYITLSGSGVKKYVDPYEFSHITCIIEPKVTSTSYSANAHLYVNGAYVASVNGTTSTTKYYNSTPHASIIEYRLNYLNTEDESQTLAVDNVSFRTFSKNSYNGNLSTVLAAKNNLSSWESNLYYASDVPAGFLKVTNETRETYYSTLTAAVSAARAGDVINVNCDLGETVNVNKAITVNTVKPDGTLAAVTLKPSTGYSMNDSIYGKYTFTSTSTPMYQYVSGGASKTATESASISDVISSADSGSTIFINNDLVIDVASKLNLTKNLTLDLTGHTLIFKQAYKTEFMQIGANNKLTVKNGTIVSGYGDTARAGKGYPLFSMGANSTILIENVNTHTSTFAWSYSSYNIKLEVVGGEHHICKPSSDVSGGFLESRNNATFTARDAVFHVSGGTHGLFSSLHYKAASTVTKKSTFSFSGCGIYGETHETSLFAYSNEFTSVYFDNCDIFGSISPILHEYETTQVSPPHAPAKKGSVVLGENVRVCGDSFLSDVVASGYGFTLVGTSSSEIVGIKCQTGTVADGNFATVNEKINCKYSYITAPIDSYTVTWYKEDGKTVIKSEQLAPGSIATPPAYVPSSNQSNGWFTASYSGWSQSFAGNATTDFTVTDNLSFYPAIVGASIEESLSAAKYNLSLLGSVKVNFYLPEAPEGLTVKGVYADGVSLFANNVFVGGKPHTVYSVCEVGASEITEEATVKVCYSVNGVDLEATFNLSPYKYASALLRDSQNANQSYDSSAYTLVADMIRYSSSLIKYMNYASGGSFAVNSDIESLLSNYSALCSALPNNFSDVSGVNISGLSGYVKSATFEVSKYQPTYKFDFVDGSGVIDCYVTLEGYYDSKISGANFGKVTYKSANKTYYRGEQLASAYIPEIPTYNIDKTVTITVLLENGMTKSGTYNLNGYYSMLSVADAQQKALVQNFIKSLRALSESTAAYRYSTVVIPESKAVDFRNCDHESRVEENFAIPNSLLPLVYTAYYCSECDSTLLYYSDFGVKGDGKTNDFAAIRKAHDAANKIAEIHPEKTVVVVSGAKKLYIADPDDSGARAISVMTNVDWDGAYFVIDDTKIDLDGGERASAKQSIFKLEGINAKRGTTITSLIPGGIKAGATNIGYAPGETLMISLVNLASRHYIRYGANVNSGASQTEVILVDEKGNIDPSTPIQWDYTDSAYCSHSGVIVNGNSTVLTKCTPTDTNGDGVCDNCKKNIVRAFSANAYTANDKPIIVSGLDKEGNINCTWESITSSNVKVDGYNQIARNINVVRSNTTIEGIDRVFTEDNTNTTPRQTYAAYVNVSYAYNTVIKDMLVCQHISHYDVNGTLLGSYEFGGSNSINTSWINCRIKNFFNSNGTVSYRGMFGSNYMRNAYLKDCVLTSFDSHSGAYNVTIEDSTFEHINFVGGGDAIMRNVTVYADGSQAACILRSDYGSMWQGNLKIDGLTLRHANNFDYIDIVKAYYTNHYFGYTSHLPTKIYANNVKIEKFTRTSGTYTMEGGNIVEPNVSTSTAKLGIHQQINKNMTKDYDYSTVNANNLDPKVCTEAVYITNSNVSIAYPDHWYFDDMKVYINGVQQNWFKVRSGLHKDSDGNGVCDNGCGQKIK